MDISFGSASPETVTADLLAAIVEDPQHLPDGLTALDASLGGALTRELRRGRLRPGKGDTAVVTGGDEGPERVLLVGTGPLEDGRAEALRKAGARIATTARGLRASRVALVTGVPADNEQSTTAGTGAVVEGFVLGAYRHDRYKSRGAADAEGPDDDGAAADDSAGQGPARHPSELEVLGAEGDDRAAIDRAIVLANATNWARDLANAPGNLMTPVILAEHARAMASHHEHLTCRVLGRAEILEQGMGMLAAVAQASPNDPQLIVLEWNPPGAEANDDERLALVGKAVTFDTGGISIKPSAGMTEMRMDKSGGCAVLGAVRAIAELQVPQRVLAVVGAAENMPGGSAYKPGDVITAMDGTTVEVTNTDAEGRLVLGDAICYARSLGCGRIAEASTLTGAMVIALGHHYAGCVARAGELTDAVLEAGRRSGDHTWHLPMHSSYKASLKSDCADMVNSGARAAGSLYAGMFLEHFAKDTPFAHVDVAGTAMLSRPQAYYTVKGATGFGVRLFTELAEHG